MKYRFLKYSLLSIIAIFFGTFATGAIMAGESDAIFSDTFADLVDETGGGATEFAGNVSSNKLTERANWEVLTNAYIGQGCVRLGTSKNDGVMTTSAIALSGDATLTFDAAGWGSGTNKVAVTAEGATIEENDITLTNGVYAQQTLKLSGATGTVKLTFTAKRMFMKNVLLKAGAQQEETTGWRDIKVDLTNGFLASADEQVQWQQLPDMGIAIAADGTVTRVAADADNAAVVLGGKWHSNEHGWAAFKAIVKVEGPVKISMGTCNWGGAVTVKNSEGAVIGTFNTNNGTCYHNDKANNVVSFNYTGGATTLTIEGGNYTPYFAVEALPKAEGTAFSVELLNSNLLFGDQINNRNLKLGLLVAADGTPSFTNDLDDKNIVAILEGGDRQDDHGWINFKATVPVKGSVKITMGSCNWGGNVTVKNSEGVEVVPSFTTSIGACYHQNKAENVVVAYYKGGATTLTIQGGAYVPYFAIEPVADWQIPNDAKVTFAVGNSGAEGNVPATQTVAFGKKLTIPVNHSLYVEGKTLTGWTDGANIYAPEDEVEIKEDTELTPIFTANTATLADATIPVTLIWQLGEKNNGKTALKFEGNTGFMVTQATFGGKTIDVKMDIDATAGKLNNAGRGDEWAQVNNGTKLTVPSAKGAVVEMNAYNDIATTTINGKTGYESGKTISATIEEEAATAEIVVNDGSYYSYVKVTLPAAKEAEPAGWKDIYVNLTGALMKSSERVEGTKLEFGVIIDENGKQTRVAADDPTANVILKGVWHDDAHGWTQAQAIVKVEGPVVIGVGNCQYGNQDASYSDAEGNKVDFKTALNCWNSDKPAENVTYINYTGGATTLTINGASYCPFFSIVAIKQQWNNEAATATFAFDQGTEDQKADFGDNDGAFLSSKIMHGETLTIVGTQTHANIKQTAFQSAIVNEANANEANAIKFIIRPYPGLVFTPTKVSFRATRWGTDSGSLDIAWMNPDGTTVSLAKGESMNRNNSDAPSAFSYVLTDATPGEGECGLLLNLYNVYDGKQMSFGNIVIEGTLNGKKQEIPVLATMTANGIVYDAEKTFEIQGDDYVANIELFKADQMISQDNPVTVVVKEGQLGSVTYEGDDSQCKVTIPVTHNDITMKWVANFVRKPFYTLTFIDADGKTVLGTQEVEKDLKVGEFAVGADKVTVASGYKFRGWTPQLAGLNTVKCSVNSTFQADTKLFPFITAIELANATARYDYDLTNVNFDPADHDVLQFEGSGYWHDKQHGWAFNKGDKIKLNMGGKGYVKLNLCQYSSAGDITLYAPDGTTVLGTCPNKAEADGGSASIQYDGAQGAGWLTLEIPAVSYIHSISIRNQAEDPYIHEDGSNFYVVKQGATATENGTNLLSMLELANGLPGTDRAIIFLPNGTYDLGETVLTAISRNNLSLVGQSMEGTIIRNAPDRSIEGIGTTATLVNTSTNLYLQDLTLQNALDYYGAVAGGQPGGRAVCLWDKGKRTVSKNVRMLSYQDTYYSNSNNQFYWETSEIHGTVDYLCGGGDVYYNEVLFVNETRKLGEKSGSDVIAAPYTDASSEFGYVFNNCTVDNKAQSFSLGRSWGGTARLTYLNTTFLQPTEIIDSRFTLSGMNVAAQNFREFNSMDKNGNIVSPASLVETFTKGDVSYTYDIILKAEEVEQYAYDKVFTEWDPASLSRQVEAPADAKYDNGTVTWTRLRNGSIAFAIFKNGEFAGLSTDDSFNITVDPAADELLIRAANPAGGFGPAAHVAGTVNGIEALQPSPVTSAHTIYNLKGQRVQKAGKGLYIVNGKKVVR